MSVPVPVVPIDIMAVPFPLFTYITIYILVSYRIYKGGICPSISNWNIWNWNTHLTSYILLLTSYIVLLYQAPQRLMKFAIDPEGIALQVEAPADVHRFEVRSQ